MRKYLSIFKISFAQEFAYRANFIMWRVRNIMQFILIFFLWDSIFLGESNEYFGYSRSEILTYIFGIMVVRAIVLSSRSQDVAGEVSRGDLSNYLVKPISYIKYWWLRDVSSKALNIIFASVELVLLYLILKPELFLQTNLIYVVLFVIALVLAVFIYFVLLFIASAAPFWWPEIAWGAQFLLTAIFVEFLSGAVFPLDILPSSLTKILAFTPFPYLMFFPVEVYLGKLAYPAVLKGIAISLIWSIILYFLMRRIWKKGLIVYQAYGR